MARHFVTWFLATLVLAHVCAQMQQTSSLQAAPHGWLSSLFLLGAARTRRKQQSPSSTKSSTLRLGPCAINGTMYPAPVLPQLLIVGAQKSGTTAVASVLAHHEQIKGPLRKAEGGDRAVVTEGHFFDFQYRSLVDQSSYLSDPNEQTCWLRNRYAAQYRRSLSSNGNAAHATSQRNLEEGGGDTAPIVVLLEKSPSYLISPHVPEAVHRLVPDAHVLVLLRNPVHRLLSHYRMMMSNQQKKQVKPDAFDASNNSSGRSLKVDRAASNINGNLRRRQRPYQEEESAPDDLEGILNQELTLLQHPVRTYLSTVSAARQQRHEANFTIPPSPSLGSGAAYDAHYHWDDLARTPSSYRGYDRLLQRGMYSVQLERWMFALGESTGSNDVKDKSRASASFDGRPKRVGRQSRRPAKLVVIPYELFESHPQAVFDYLWKRLKVRPCTVPSSILHARYSSSEERKGASAATASNSSDTTTHPHDHDAMTPHVMDFLYRFYRPYNDRLADLLGEEWRGIWDMPVAVTTKRKGAAAGAGTDDVAAAAALGDDDGEEGEAEDADDDDAIDSDPHAWKRVWLDKILRE
jgi:Sulfotransferase family